MTVIEMRETLEITVEELSMRLGCIYFFTITVI
jgi:hypothetical protein